MLHGELANSATSHQKRLSSLPLLTLILSPGTFSHPLKQSMVRGNTGQQPIHVLPPHDEQLQPTCSGKGQKIAFDFDFLFDCFLFSDLVCKYVVVKKFPWLKIFQTSLIDISHCSSL